MRMFFKILAILCLLATIAMAGVILFAVNNHEPVITEVRAQKVDKEAEYVALTWQKIEKKTFEGRTFAQTLLPEEEAGAVDLTLRISNPGLLPMEWIAVGLVPGEADLAEETDSGAYVLSPRAQGEMHLRRISRDGTGSARVWISYYLYGHPFRVEREITWTEEKKE